MYWAHKDLGVFFCLRTDVENVPSNNVPEPTPWVADGASWLGSHFHAYKTRVGCILGELSSTGAGVVQGYRCSRRCFYCRSELAYCNF
jgi:hypothetical protein